MDLFSKALKDTASKLAPRLTQTLVQFAISDGWEPRVANGLKVTYSNKRYHLSVTDSVKEAAFAYEYGDGTTPPKGTVRRFGNLNNIAEKQFVLMFKQVIK